MLGLLLAVILSDPSDEELVERFQRGDRACFGMLVDRYQDRVYGLCLRMLGNPAEAEEVAQEVFLALFKSLDRFRGDARLSTWVYRVSLNHCRNHHHYRRRRGHGLHEALDAPVGGDSEGPRREVADSGRGADATADATEAERLVREGLAALDEDHRQIIILRDIQDLDYDEIAELLELPRGTVKSRLHRARAELARRLAKALGRG